MYHTIHSRIQVNELQVNDYLLRDRRIQNPVGDLRWSALKK